MPGQLWRVVGGAGKGGILVREGKDTSSVEKPSRLATGALVEQLALEDGRLQYKRLTGDGPDTGWVSMLFNSTSLLVEAPQAESSMMPGPVWRVVGGASKGGILVREGKDTSSVEKLSRLATGALVEQLALEDGRLQYKRLTGGGPDIGWVSVSLNSIPLVVEAAELESGAFPLHSIAVTKKARILALHGKCSNSSIMTVQCSELKSKLGDDAEWCFLNGNVAYDPEKEAEPHYVPSKFETMLSKGKPFMQWYNHRKTDARYEFVSDGLDHIMNCFKEQGPFDVVVAFSMASNVISMLLDRMRREDQNVPWRLNVFFAGGIPRDGAYVIEDPLSQPTIKINGGSSDPFWPGGEPSLQSIYSNLIELSHEDGHAFPRTQPRATEIYAVVAAEIRKHCGLLA